MIEWFYINPRIYLEEFMESSWAIVILMNIYLNQRHL